MSRRARTNLILVGWIVICTALAYDQARRFGQPVGLPDPEDVYPYRVWRGE